MSRRRDDTWENGELSKSLKDARESKKSSKSRDDRPREGSSRERPKSESKSKHDRGKTDDRKKENEKPSRSERTERRDDVAGKSSERKKSERERNGEGNGDDRKKHREKSERGEEGGRGEKKKSRNQETTEKDDSRRHRSNRNDEIQDDDSRRHRSNRNDEIQGDDKRRDRSKERRHRDDGERREERPKHRGQRGEDDSTRKHRERSKERKHRNNEEDMERSHRRKNDESKHLRESEKRAEESGDRRRTEQRREDRDRGTDGKKERRRKDEVDEDVKKSSDDKKRHEDKKVDIGRKLKDETNHRSSSDDNKNTQNKKHIKKQEEEEEEEDYEDDFEDYEDDFEDDGEESTASGESGLDPEMRAIRQAMSEENRAVLTPPHHPRDPPNDEVKPEGRTFVNFTSAKQRQIREGASMKSWKRGRELFSLIELDIVSFNMFELQPLREYEMYIRSFGASHTKQVYTQCNDDNVDRDIQTDLIDTQNRWTQHPPDTIGVKCFGCDTVDEDESGAWVRKQTDAHLGTFLQNSGQTISILLDENVLRHASVRSKRSQVTLNFSEQMSQIVTDLPILHQRRVTHVEFSPFDPNLIICAFGRGGGTNLHKHLTQKSMLCTWNINEPTRPQKVLICESVPSFCCFSPFKPILAFSGSVDGSISVWDLREPSHLHSRIKQGMNEWIIRSPTYSTDGLTSVDNHQVPITAMKALYSVTDTDKVQSQLSFQIVSLDELGVINFWVVVETPGSETCSETDLGLLPGGHVSLVKTSTLNVAPKNHVTSFRTMCLSFSEHSPNELLVGTDQGRILQVSRYSKSGRHTIYQPTVQYPVEISSIDFNPFLNSRFIVGCKDGSIYLYCATTQSPMVSWYDITAGESVDDVCWSSTRPSVFYIRTPSKLYVMDLSVDTRDPILSEHFTTSPLLVLAHSSPKTAPHPQQTGSSSRKSTHILLGFADGRIEVYTPNKKLRKSTEHELDVLVDVLSL